MGLGNPIGSWPKENWAGSSKGLTGKNPACSCHGAVPKKNIFCDSSFHNFEYMSSSTFVPPTSQAQAKLLHGSPRSRLNLMTRAPQVPGLFKLFFPPGPRCTVFVNNCSHGKRKEKSTFATLSWTGSSLGERGDYWSQCQRRSSILDYVWNYTISIMMSSRKRRRVVGSPRIPPFRKESKSRVCTLPRTSWNECWACLYHPHMHKVKPSNESDWDTNTAEPPANYELRWSSPRASSRRSLTKCTYDVSV